MSCVCSAAWNPSVRDGLGETRGCGEKSRAGSWIERKNYSSELNYRSAPTNQGRKDSSWGFSQDTHTHTAQVLSSFPTSRTHTSTRHPSPRETTALLSQTAPRGRKQAAQSKHITNKPYCNGDQLILALIHSQPCETQPARNTGSPSKKLLWAAAWDH